MGLGQSTACLAAHGAVPRTTMKREESKAYMIILHAYAAWLIQQMLALPEYGMRVCQRLRQAEEVLANAGR